MMSSDSEGEHHDTLASKYTVSRLRKRAKDVRLPSSDESSRAGNDNSDLSMTSNSSDDGRQHPKRKRQELDESTSSAQSSHDTSDNSGNESEPAGAESPPAVDDNMQADNEQPADGQQDAVHIDEVQNNDVVPEGIIQDDDASEHDSSDGETESDEELDTSSESEHDDEVEQEEGDRPLYANAPLSVLQSVLSILSFTMSHNITGRCLSDLLQLIILHCPQPNACVPSLYKFQKFFSDMGRQILKSHYFCEVCFSRVDSKNSICNQCGDQTVVSYFLEIPLLGQLQRLFLKPGFFEDLRYRFRRRKQFELNVEDCYDGEVYKREVNNGFLNSLQAISLMIYWDGISIFRSSKLQFWPVYYVIQELSYKKRILKENIILAGLWFGNYKPNVNLFFEPFLESLEQFKNEGFLLNLPGDPPAIRVKRKLLCATCDLQAKSIMMRMKMHNGYYGCANCRSRGQHVRVGVNSSVHVHRYNREEMIPRAHEETKRFAELAIRHNAPCFGVKGPTLLAEMIVNMIKGMGIDVMHNVFLGVMKLLTHLWFDPSYNDFPFSISRLADVVDERLGKIKSPGFVKPIARSIKNYRKLWKSSEFRQWFFYLSIPVLNGLLPVQYLNHHIKLVSAIFLLNQKSIFPEQINAAEVLLHDYVENFQIIYGERFMVMNVHILLHLPQVVRDLGPLWVYSCAFLEDLNGQLGRLVHGTQYVGLQVCSSAIKYMCLSNLIEQLPPDSAVYHFCVGISPHNQAYSRLKVAEEIGQFQRAIGKYTLRNNLSDDDKLTVQQNLNINGGHFQSFLRLSKGSYTITCDAYTRAKSTVSCFVEVRNGHGNIYLCKVKEFFRWSGCDCPNVCHCQPASFFCLVEMYERQPWIVNNVPHVQMMYLSKVVPTAVVRAFLINNIHSICYYVPVDNDEYIGVPINECSFGDEQ